MNKVAKACTGIWSVAALAVALSLMAPGQAFSGGFGSEFFQTGDKAQAAGPWLGVQVETVTADVASKFDLKVSQGVYVRSVVDASPAEEAGIQPGDVIIEYNYKKVTTSDNLATFVSDDKVGDEAILFIDRDGSKKRLATNLTARPENKTSRIEKLTLPAPDRDGMFEYRVTTAPYIGVALQSISGQLAAYFNIPGGEGALIIETLEGSPAEDAGLKAGDVVVEADGSPIEVTEDLQRVVRDRKSGDRIDLTVMRNKKKTKFTVTVAEREAPREEFGGPRMFGFDAPFNDDALGETHPFGKHTRHFAPNRKGRGLDQLNLPDVVYSRTEAKSKRIDQLEKRIKELEEQIDSLRDNDK